MIKKKIKQKKKKNFFYYNNNLFNYFLEVDGAYINTTKESLTYTEKICPFMNQDTFIISKNNNKIYINKSAQKLGNNELEISPKSIIICECKSSIPKDLLNFAFNNDYSRNQIENTLLFTLNKLVKKIPFYYEYIKNEVLTEEEDINSYRFELFLIYNNVPVEDIDEIIKNDLEKLIENKYINIEFIFHIIYLMPNLGIYNINKIEKALEKTQNDLEKIQKDYNNVMNQLNKVNQILRKNNLLVEE